MFVSSCPHRLFLAQVPTSSSVIHFDLAAHFKHAVYMPHLPLHNQSIKPNPAVWAYTPISKRGLESDCHRCHDWIVPLHCHQRGHYFKLAYKFKPGQMDLSHSSRHLRGRLAVLALCDGDKTPVLVAVGGKGVKRRTGWVEVFSGNAEVFCNKRPYPQPQMMMRHHPGLCGWQKIEL